MIEKFDAKQCSVVFKDVMAALEAVGQKHGLIFQRDGGGSFVADAFNFKLVAKTTNGGTAEDVRRREFERHCALFDLEPGDYRATFKMRGEEHRIVGFNLNRPKFSIRTERVSDGKAAAWPDEVTNLIERKRVKA